MIGLRPWVRDADLPAAGGDEALRAWPEAQVRGWVEERLLLPGQPAVASVVWNYARWKPGTSLTCGYDVRFQDGVETAVVAKRYLDGKDRELADRREAEPATGENERLRRRARLDGLGVVLWSHRGDRLLPGIDALYDRRRLARWIEESGLVPPRTVRRRRIEHEVLRYKPERRCVASVELSLRDTEPSARSFAVRVQPPATAASIAARRRGLERVGGSSLAPRLLLCEERLGLLLEEWLALEVPAPDAFEHAHEAGRLLAGLHGMRVEGGGRTRRTTSAAQLVPLFRVAPALVSIASELLARRARPRDRTWIHGDLHPDQVARDVSTARAVLLDLDGVGVGDPRRDLASWIADHLLERPGESFEGAAEPLVAGYRAAGGRMALDELREPVVFGLVCRAGAAIRRLERGAPERARRLLERAAELSGKAVG